MSTNDDLDKYKKFVDDKAYWAISHKARRRGLSRIDLADAPQALYFHKCRSIHTFGMRFDLEVIYFDRDGKLIESKVVPPRRLLKSPKGTYSILEIPLAKLED